MRVRDTLAEDRIYVFESGSTAPDKAEVLALLGRLLAPATGESADTVERRLHDREAVQSTAIGQGVAIPHATLPSLRHQVAALLVHPVGVPFDSVDGEPAQLIMGVVGPQNATGHLKFLARVSKLFRRSSTRRALIEASDAAGVLALLEAAEEGL